MGNFQTISCLASLTSLRWTRLKNWKITVVCDILSVFIALDFSLDSSKTFGAKTNRGDNWKHNRQCPGQRLRYSESCSILFQFSWACNRNFTLFMSHLCDVPIEQIFKKLINILKIWIRIECWVDQVDFRCDSNNYANSKQPIGNVTLGLFEEYWVSLKTCDWQYILGAILH